MILVERPVKELPAELRSKVFGWAEENRLEILKLLEQGRSVRLYELPLYNAFYGWGFDDRDLRLDDGRSLSEMALCGEVGTIGKRFPLDGFGLRKMRVVVRTRDKDVEGGEVGLFDHMLLMGQGGMICCLTPGQFVFGCQDVRVIYGLSDVVGLKTYFPGESFKPGGRLERLKELMPGAVRTFGGGLGVLCASVYAIERELGLRFVEVAD